MASNTTHKGRNKRGSELPLQLQPYSQIVDLPI